MASHQPQKMNQRMFPIVEATPWSARLTIVRPKGQRQKTAIRSEAIPKGIVMMKMNMISAANA
jgi:hypothetical protein